MSLFSRKPKGPKRRKKSRLPRQLKTTGEGKLLIGLTLGLGFGAINSGNNLLYLIMGMLLSLIVVSGILSEYSLRGVVVRRRFRPGLHAGRDTFLSYEITNTKKRLASWSVEIEEIFGVDGKWITDLPFVYQRPAYALHLKPGETQAVAMKLRIDRRGLHKSDGVRIATRYPFSFFRKSLDVTAGADFVVYPSIHAVVPPGRGRLADGAGESSQKLGRGGEYHGLREHRLEDDPRDIHWKTSARMGRLVSREYERSADRRVWLLVQNAMSDTHHADHVESAISETASLAHYYQREGWGVGIRTLDGGVEPGNGPGHLTQIMEHLARIAVHGPNLADVRSMAAPAGGRAVERILVRHPAQRELALSAGTDHVHEAGLDANRAGWTPTGQPDWTPTGQAVRREV